MNFQIMQQVAGKQFVPAINKRTKGPLIYQCPKQAASIAARLTKMKGVKFQPRPLIENKWREREQKRLDDNTYQPVVWIGMKWWDHNRPNHFAHVDTKDPTLVAFTRNDKEGTADIQASMKPGKYLTEFFGEVLTPEEIRTYAMQHSMKFENKELLWAWTPEEIEMVYKPYVGGSCFSGTKNANLYGSGDFAVAYIVNGNGDITARAICAPDRKIHTTIYGDRDRLGKLLKDAGFKFAYGAEWKGLRLLKAHYWRGFYSDFGRNGTSPLDDTYLIID